MGITDLSKIENQTEEICLEAVKQDGSALQFVGDRTEDICLEAVKQNHDAIKYVTDPKILEKYKLVIDF